MKVYCVITTKNRFEFFTKAFNSVKEQTKKPFQIIVISDSDNAIYEKEKDLISKNGILLKDQYEHNYAGSLNTAIDYIIKEEINNNNIFDISNTYAAFLDDDDTMTHGEKIIWKYVLNIYMILLILLWQLLII